MSIQGQPFTLTYTVLDITTFAPLDGDVANHTVRVYSDGTGFTPSGTITGIGGGSGEYKLTITGGENAGTAMKAIPKTSTSGKFIAPVLWNNTSSTLVANVQQVATEFSVGSRIAASGIVSAVTDTKTFTITFSNGTGPAVANQFAGQTLEVYNPGNPQARASARIVSHGTVDSQPIAFVVATDILTVSVGHSVSIIIDSPLGASSSSSGTGSYAITVHVTDGLAANLIGAQVTLTDGVLSYVATTIAGGLATFSLNAATYTLTITKAGYTYTPTTQVVGGVATITAALTAIVIPGAGVVNGASVYAYARGIDGVVSEGKTFFVRLVSSNTSFDFWNGETVESSESDSTGYAALTVRLGASAQASLDKINWTPTFTVSTDPYHLQEIVGTDWD